MIPINIDLTGYVKKFSLGPMVSKDLREFIYQETISTVAKAWDEQAKNSLSKSREEYRRSLMIVEKGRFSGQIILNGILPNMIEQGASPFDMKEGFSKSAKKTLKKDGGWYLTIPFRFATPGAIGESSIFSGKLTPEVYNEVKSSGVITNKSPLPTSSLQPTIRKSVTIKSKTYDSYIAKSSIFIGLKKTSKQYESAKQNTYSSFRRVSNSSDENAFIHSGITARNLSNKAIESANLPQLIPQLTDTFLRGVFQ